MKFDKEKNSLVDDQGNELAPEKVAEIYQQTTQRHGQEMADERKKKQEEEALRKLAEQKLEEARNAGKPQDPQNVNVDEVVDKKLREREALVAVANRKKAEEKFKNENKEFHPDNDPGGVKFAAVQNKLARFNLDGLVEEEQFTEVMNEALRLVREPAKADTGNYNQHAYTPSGNGSAGARTNPDTISPVEQAAYEKAGMTKERYLALRKKRPEETARILGLQ